MKINDLQRYRDDKNGFVSPESLRDQINDNFKEHKITKLVYVATDEEDNLIMGYSDMSYIEAFGMLEYGKLGVLPEEE